MKLQTVKARLVACWECGRKFRGRRCVRLIVNGHPVEVHKACIEDLMQHSVVTHVDGTEKEE